MPLDIVTTKNLDHYEHNRLDDCSLFSERGKVRRVPIDALLSKPDLTPSGEVIQEIVTPKRLDGYSALINAASGELLVTRPIGK